MIAVGEKRRWWTGMPQVPKRTFGNHEAQARHTDICANCGHTRFFHRVFPMTGHVRCICQHGTPRECDCVATSPEYAFPFHYAGIPDVEKKRIQDSHTPPGGKPRLLPQPAVPGKPIPQ